MRRPDVNAAVAWFNPLNGQTRNALERGVAISSAARFPGLGPVSASLLLEAFGESGFGGLVRVEFLVKHEARHLLQTGASFDLVAGNSVLGTGIVIVAPKKETALTHPLDKAPSKIWEGGLPKTLWTA